MYLKPSYTLGMNLSSDFSGIQKKILKQLRILTQFTREELTAKKLKGFGVVMVINLYKCQIPHCNGRSESFITAFIIQRNRKLQDNGMAKFLTSDLCLVYVINASARQY